MQVGSLTGEIKRDGNLVGEISTVQNLVGELNNAIIELTPELEDLTVTPDIVEQNFKSNMYGYNNVKVEAIQGEDITIKPTMEEQKYNGVYRNVTVEPIESEEISITPSANEQTKEGLFDKVTVTGDSNLIPENIKTGVEVFGVTGTAEIRGEENAVVKTKIPNSTQSTGGALVQCITHINTSLKASGTSCEYMFYYCTGLKYIKDIDTTNVTNMKSMFNYCNALETVPQMDTSKVKNMSAMFASCGNLKSVPLFDTSNVTDMSSMLTGCTSLVEIPQFDTSNVTTMYFFCGNNRYNLKTIPLLDLGKVNNLSNMFTGCNALENLGGFKDLGKAYTKTTTNNSAYELKLSVSTNLTHESLMNVINNLYDLNLSYNVANGGTLYRQKLNIGSTNIAKLTEEEIAIATNKGWNVI